MSTALVLRGKSVCRYNLYWYAIRVEPDNDDAFGMRTRLEVLQTMDLNGAHSYLGPMRWRALVEILKSRGATEVVRVWAFPSTRSIRVSSDLREALFG